MSDGFEMIVDSDVTIEEAAIVAESVLALLRAQGLVAGEANAHCVLAGSGYQPGPALSKAYIPEAHEPPFWRLTTCGVEPRVGRDFNQWALGPSCEGFTCPTCEARFEPDDEDLDPAVAEAIGQWMDESGPAIVPCPRCNKEMPITQWRCEPPLGFGNLSFVFWNWPPLCSPSWQIDILDLVRKRTGHNVIRTHGRI